MRERDVVNLLVLEVYELALERQMRPAAIFFGGGMGLVVFLYCLFRGDWVAGAMAAAFIGPLSGFGWGWSMRGSLSSLNERLFRGDPELIGPVPNRVLKKSVRALLVETKARLYVSAYARKRYSTECDVQLPLSGGARS